jgi:hypothetical protein
MSNTSFAENTITSKIFLMISEWGETIRSPRNLALKNAAFNGYDNYTQSIM